MDCRQLIASFDLNFQRYYAKENKKQKPYPVSALITEGGGIQDHSRAQLVKIVLANSAI